MRVYFDTGVFIDYLSTRGNTTAILRPSERRGRAPAEIAADAEVELFNLSMLDLTSGTVRLQLPQLDLQTRGIRAAEALHAASAIAFDADLLVSTDDALLHLDGILLNTRGRNILCRDTDLALQLL